MVSPTDVRLPTNGMETGKTKSRMTSRNGHSVCWMSMGGKNSWIKHTHSSVEHVVDGCFGLVSQTSRGSELNIIYSRLDGRLSQG